MFTNTPTQPTCVGIQVMSIYFDAPCKNCRDGKARPRISGPVDYIEGPTADLNVCTTYALSTEP